MNEEEEKYAEYLVTAKIYDDQERPTDEKHTMVFVTSQGTGLEEKMKKLYEQSFSRDRITGVLRKVESVRQIQPGEVEIGMQFGI